MTSLSLRRQIAGLGISPQGAPRAGAGPVGDTEAPSVPQNLSASAISSSQINLTWDASTDNVGVTGYNVYRDNVLIDTSPTNAYSDTGLAAGTQYQYEVSAFDAASNESARSTPAGATTQQVIVAAGLIAEWRFDDGAGQTLTDASGHGHHGQLGSTAGADANDPAWATNPLRLQFDGVNDRVIVPAFAGPTAYHLDLVVKADPASASSAMLFVAHGLADGDAILQVFKNGSGNQLKYRTRHAAGTQNYVGSITVFDNAWHLVQLSHNGSQIVVHIDGNLDLPAQAVNPLPSSNGPIWLGARGAGGGQLFLKGAEAWAAWYSIGFDASQRAQNEAYARDLMAQRGVTLP